MKEVLKEEMNINNSLLKFIITHLNEMPHPILKNSHED
jgi:hypothetical protein